MTIYHHDTDSLVIIPTYNEVENIALLIDAIFATSPTFHILVVDDASPDGTGDVVAGLQSQYNGKLHLLSRPQKAGLGTAYIAGFKFALANSYQYILTMDADFSHPIDKLQVLYETCNQQEYDVTIGSRYVNGVNVVNWPMGRVLLSYIANWIARYITGLPIMDLTAGYQCYKRAVLETIDLGSIKSIGYSFQVEMKFLAYQYGFKLKEIPIVFTNRIRGSSKMSHHIILEAFFRIIKLKVSSLFKSFHRTLL
ncbi:polyprenol monophosphomannose synthase [Candidatus Amoebophilus asiaticus]|uniref:polyprenol monophosphomannose synthase n=1 Tax=Candidatus Amoebophilus asiaticus TaxID=281120 RepID=UPI0001715200|nr:polyprenol monophosphomannose synthase [Candidatus Amoebophilus asiaticus]